jgi:hypothetical protein
MHTSVIKQRFVGQLASFILSAASVMAATRTVSAPARQGVRCMAEPEAQASEGSSVDIWLGRAAMVAFTAVLTTEIVSGKGVFSVSPRTDAPPLVVGWANDSCPIHFFCCPVSAGSLEYEVQ